MVVVGSRPRFLVVTPARNHRRRDPAWAEFRQYARWAVLAVVVALGAAAAAGLFTWAVMSLHQLR